MKLSDKRAAEDVQNVEPVEPQVREALEEQQQNQSQ
jgi:hypothetical protein